MSGIYVHIPFCKSKCYYCDFYSVTRVTGQVPFVGALLRELDLRNDYLLDKQVDTIYFGGGTPTLLPPGQLGRILDKLRALYEIPADAEITIEANPDDLDPEKLDRYLDIGFNRISIGTQSFDNAHLKMMNRRHDASQAFGSVEMAGRAGFSSISLDLIYGIPGMTLAGWAENLRLAASLPVEHISAYHLTIEPGTRFGKLKRSGLFTEIPDDQSVAQYLRLLEMTAAAGFEQYEISNFARNGRYSRHNTKYWTGESYLGLGPSAHSFNGTHRHWNPSSLTAYIRDVQEGKIPGGEYINPVMRRNEYVMTRLRTAAGIDGAHFSAAFGPDGWCELLSAAEKHLSRGHLVMENGRLFFNRQAWFHSDGILSDLFLVS